MMNTYLIQDYVEMSVGDIIIRELDMLNHVALHIRREPFIKLIILPKEHSNKYSIKLELTDASTSKQIEFRYSAIYNILNNGNDTYIELDFKEYEKIMKYYYESGTNDILYSSHPRGTRIPIMPTTISDGSDGCSNDTNKYYTI